MMRVGWGMDSDPHPPAQLTFEGDLQDLVRRSGPGPVAFDATRRASVKDVLESLGVPHTEVYVLSVDGRAVDFGHLLEPGQEVILILSSGPEPDYIPEPVTFGDMGTGPSDPPKMLYGSGINGAFTVGRGNGVELGLRAQLRFDENNHARNIFNSNNDGTYRFPAEYLGKFPESTRAVVLVAVDARTHQPYANNLVPLGATVVDEEGPPPKDPDWMENHFVQMYFNVDLRRYLELPRADADYWVYALLEDHVSNVVRVAFRV